MSNKFQEKHVIIFAKNPSRMRCFIRTAKYFWSFSNKVILSTFQFRFRFIKNDFLDIARLSFVHSNLVICLLRYANYCLVLQPVTSQRTYEGFLCVFYGIFRNWILFSKRCKKEPQVNAIITRCTGWNQLV